MKISTLLDGRCYHQDSYNLWVIFAIDSINCEHGQGVPQRQSRNNSFRVPHKEIDAVGLRQNVPGVISILVLDIKYFLRLFIF